MGVAVPPPSSVGVGVLIKASLDAVARNASRVPATAVSKAPGANTVPSKGALAVDNAWIVSLNAAS